MVGLKIAALFVLLCLGAFSDASTRKHRKNHRNNRIQKATEAQPADVKALQDDLLARADMTAKPDNLEVEMGLSLLAADPDASGKITIATVERYNWVDSRLRWDENEYQDIAQVHLPSDSIWLPDITLYNNPTAVQRAYSDAVVSSNGGVSWIPPSQYAVPCQTNGEGKNCALNYGSWFYNSGELNLVKSDYGFNYTDMFDSFSKYKVSAVTGDTINLAYYPCCADPYQTWAISFTLAAQY